MGASDGRLFIAEATAIDVFANDKLVDTVSVKDFTPTSIAASGSLVAVGTDKNKIGKLSQSS